MNGARRPRFRALQRDHIGSVDPHALKIAARRAEYSLAEISLSPVQAEPTQGLRFVRISSVSLGQQRRLCKLAHYLSIIWNTCLPVG